jgi:hypothetical protein
VANVRVGTLVAWLGIAAAVISLVAAMVNSGFIVRHHRKDNERFAEVHSNIRRLNGAANLGTDNDVDSDPSRGLHA